jgi:RHS repeat-associated protein
LAQMVIRLYYYRARWYDPYITQFTQPDSIIPDPYNPLDWNRYSYVRYNPINYNDPSGHWARPGDRGITDSWEGTPFSVAYNVVFRGKWSYDSMQTAMSTVKQVGSAISQAIYNQSGEYSTSSEAFGKAFGNLTFEGVGRGKLCGGCLGQAAYPVIKLVSEQASPRLIAHELGHAFEQGIRARNGNKYRGTNNPVQYLVGNGIYDSDGNLVTGYNRASGSYTRWNGQNAPRNGFTSNKVPGQYHGIEFDDWNNVHEGFADIFLNWAFNSFAQNTAGTAMYVWTATNMAEWVNSGR